MLKRVIKFKDVQAAFLEKYPGGSINHEGEWTGINDDGTEVHYRGKAGKVLVSYSEYGKVYGFLINNHLELAHKLGLLTSIGYANTYVNLQREVNRYQELLDKGDDENPFGFGKMSPARIKEKLDEALVKLQEFEQQYTEVA